MRNVGESWEQRGGNLYCSPIASGPAAANATQFLQRRIDRGTGGDAPAESSSSMMPCCQLGSGTLSLSHTQAHNTAARCRLISTNDDQATQLRCEARRHLHHRPTRASIGSRTQSLELPDKGLEPIWTSSSASNPLRDFCGDLRRCTTAAGWAGEAGHGRLTSRRSNVSSHATLSY